MAGKFPGDFENFTKSKEFKDSKKSQKDKYEKDKQHPVKGKHAAFDRLVNAGKKEVEAFKTYRKNRAEVRDRNKPASKSTDVEAVMLKKGGSVKKKKSSRKALRGGGCEIR